MLRIFLPLTSYALDILVVYHIRLTSDAHLCPDPYSVVTIDAAGKTYLNKKNCVIGYVLLNLIYKYTQPH